MKIDEWEMEVDAIDPDTGEILAVTVDWKNTPSVKLLILELVSLLDDMRVGASPFADRLGNALQRWGIEEEAE